VPGAGGIGGCPLAADSSGPEPIGGEVGMAGAADDWDGVGTSFVSVPSATLISVGDDALFGEPAAGCSTALVAGVGDLASRAGAAFDAAGVAAATAVPGAPCVPNTLTSIRPLLALTTKL